VQVPGELREAALVDGATPRQAFLHVVLPLARNSVLVTGILVFLQTLGEYVFSRSLILDDKYTTTTVALAAFVGDTKTDWVGIMTYAAIYTTPILITFMLLQRRIVSGLTAGALK
jgi:multiple sugar transport system permease protein